jgi:hypothetical protein
MDVAEFTRLNSEGVRKHHVLGYSSPIRIFDPTEAAAFRKHFDDFFAYHAERLKSPCKQTRAYLGTPAPS